MKLLRLCTLVVALLLCASLSACGNVPAEHILSNNTGNVTEQNSVTTTALNADASVQQITAMIASKLDWVRSFRANNFETAPSVQISFQVPEGWNKQGYTFFSPDENEQFSPAYVLYEIGANTPLSALPGSYKQTVTPIQSAESSALFFQIYPYKEENCNFYYYIDGYVRLDGHYAWGFGFYSKDISLLTIENILQTANINSIPEAPVRSPSEVQCGETLHTVRIDNLQYVADKIVDSVHLEDLPKTRYLEIDLPVSWQILPQNHDRNQMDNIYYAELGIPGEGLSEDICYYQAFMSDFLYTKNSVALPAVDAQTTASGKCYWLESQIDDDYHAISYTVYIQLSDDYFYCFYLCTDSNNADLVYSIIESIEIQ